MASLVRPTDAHRLGVFFAPNAAGNRSAVSSFRPTGEISLAFTITYVNIYKISLSCAHRNDKKTGQSSVINALITIHAIAASTNM